MKYAFSLFLLILFSLNTLATGGTVFSQSPTAAEDDTEDIETIEKIKDLVASKVAELDLVERRGIFGIVKTTGNTQLTLMDHNNIQRSVDIDELTEFENGDEDDFGISDIEGGDVIEVVGLYNKDNARMLARFIAINDSIPENIDGEIKSLDEEEFTLTVATASDTYTIDIETSTDTTIFEKGESDESGFSDLKVGQRVIIVGFKDDNEDKRITASRLIHFANIPPSSDIKTVSEEQKVSSGSAGQVEVID